MIKLIIKKAELESAIKKISGVYSQMAKKDSAVIVLQAVCGKKGENIFKGLSLLMFNGSTQVATNIFCEMESEITGNVSVSVGPELISAINALAGVNAGTYSIVIDNTVVVSKGENRITVNKKIEGLMPVEFDIRNKECKISARLALDIKSFKTAIGSILFAALADDEKAVGGIGVMASKEQIILRATDTYRLAEAVCKVKQAEMASDVTDFVISPSVIKQIIATVVTDVVLIKTEKHLLIQSGKDLWQIALLQKNYQHKIFENIKSIEKGGAITFKKTDMLVALDVVSATETTFDNMICEVVLEQDKVVVYGKERLSKAVIDVTVEGDIPATVVFSIKLLKSGVSAFKSETINIYLDSKKPNIFSAEGEELFVALCPVKL